MIFWVGDPVCIPETIGTPLCPQQADDDHSGKKPGPYDACCVLVANGYQHLDMSGPVSRSNSCVCLSVTRRGRGDVGTPPQPGRTQARRATSNTRADSPPGRHVKDSLKAMQASTLLSIPTESAPLRLARRRLFPFASRRCRLNFALRGPGRRPSSTEDMSFFAVTAGWMDGRRPQRRPGGVEKPASCTGFFDTTRAAHDGCASVPGIDPNGSVGINR